MADYEARYFAALIVPFDAQAPLLVIDPATNRIAKSRLKRIQYKLFFCGRFSAVHVVQIVLAFRSDQFLSLLKRD